jgi:TP901 family phage tail tape measure protein
MNLEERIAATRTLTNLEELKQQRDLTSIRLGHEVNLGNEIQKRLANDLLILTDGQISGEQQRLALMKAQKAEMASTPQARGAATRERLFGDGGAGLLLIQAGLMANYSLINAVQSGIVNTITFAVELDQEMANLQAISQGTNTDMQTLRQTFVDVANSSRFTSIEVAKAAVTMAQAGMSTSQIKESITSVAALATATGEDFGQTVDLVTSVIGVFNLEAGQMAIVANEVTQALNLSKLTLEKLTLGLQYVGNTAADAGISFEETAAALGAMSNAGVRSGSTLGTGLRGVITNLEKPTKAFRERLAELGLTMSDVDLTTKGLYGVMTTLADAGFTAKDAINSFDIRAAAAFTALSAQLPSMVELQLAFVNSRAAIDANAIQMNTLSSQAGRLGNATMNLLSTALQPFLDMLRDLSRVLADVVSFLTPIAPLLGVVATAALGAGAAFGLMKLGILVKELYAIATAAKGAAVATGLFLGLTPVGWAIAAGAAIAGVAYAFYRLSAGSAAAAKSMEAIKTRQQEAAGEADKYAEQMGIVSEKLTEVKNKSTLLDNNQVLLSVTVANVKSQFAEMGLQGAQMTATVSGMTTALEGLYTQLTKKYIMSLGIEGQSLTAMKALLQQDVLDNQSGKTGAWMPQGARNPGRDPRLDAIRNSAQTPGIQQDVARDLRTQGQTILNEYELKQRKGSLTSFDEWNKAYAELIVKQTDSLLAAIERRDSNDVAQQKVADDARDALMTLSPQFKAFKAASETLQDQVKADLAKVGKQFPGNSPEALINRSKEGDRIKALYEPQFNLLETRLIELVKTGVLSPTVANSLQQPNNVNRAGLNKNTGSLVDDAAKPLQQAREDRDRLVVMQQANALAQAEVRFGKESYQVAKMKVDQEWKLNELKMIAAGSTQAAIAAEKLQYDLANQIGSQAEFQTQQKINQLVTLQAAQQPLAEQVNLNYLIWQYGEDSYVVAQKKLEMERELYRQQKIAEGIIGENLLNLMSSWDAANGVARANMAGNIQAALGPAARLAATLWNAAAAAGAALQYERAKPENASILLGGVRPEFVPNQAQRNVITTARLNIQAEKSRKASENIGGGGGSPRGGSGSPRGGRGSSNVDDRSVTDSFKEALDGALANPAAKDLEALVKNVLTTANAQLKITQTKIAALVGKDRTQKEQIELNKLLKDQGTLTEFILEAEDKIGIALGKQGKLYLNLNSLMKEFTEKNLNINVALKSGVTGVLGEWKTAFKELFSSIDEGGKSGKEMLRDFAVSGIKSLEGLVTELLSVYAMKSGLGMLGGSVGGTNMASQMMSMIGMNEGGRVGGTIARDSVPRALMPDEYVVSAPASRAMGYDKLDEINRTGQLSSAAPQMMGAAARKPEKPKQPLNIWIAPPDARPIPGPNDIIAVISDDMARGGVTKRLVKTIQHGG